MGAVSATPIQTTSASELVAAFAAEIDKFAAANQPHEAVERLLELAKEFSPDRALINRATLIAARYTEWRQTARIAGLSSDIQATRNLLLFDLLQVKDDVVAAHSTANRPVTVAAQAPPPPLRLVTATPQSSLVKGLDDARREFREAREREKTPDESEQSVAFRCKDLCKSHGSRFQLRNLTFSIKPGEILGLIGANASGKTTLLEMIGGSLKPDAGEIAYPALEREAKTWAGVRRQIAYVSQHLQSWQGNVVDQLHLWAALYGIKGKENVDEVEWLLHRLDLADYRGMRWQQLSGGFRMRFALARALLTRPRLLVLDEPLAHLDIITQQMFLRDLRAISLSPTRPLPIIVSSQHLYEIESIADRLLFLDDGEPVFYGDLSELARQRESNIMELGVESSRDEVHAMLQSLGGVRVEPLGLQYLVTAPKQVATNSVLEKLLDSSVSVEYFRDISRSTVNLFRIRRGSRSE